jgi:creatinine amidohydrolase
MSREGGCVWLGIVLLLLSCDDRPARAPSMPKPDPASRGAAPEPGAAPAPSPTPRPSAAARGVLLWDLTWPQAEAVLTPDAVVVLPLGAASKEHGPHLLLKNDWLLAEYYQARVLAAADVVIAPTLGYHHYPAFVEYPGSTSLSAEVARDVVVEICRGLARFGPRRFYVLNTGVSTVRPLRAAAEVLAAEGILMRFTDILALAEPVEKEVSEQPGGTHADEIETSMMLYIAPETVDMTKAVRDWAPKSKPGFSRTPDGPGHHSASGVWGDATLATRDKGERVVEHMVAGILAEIEALRVAPLPAASEPASATATPAP